MKKAFSLIELIFSIVVIGLCLSAVPRVVEVSLKSDEIGYRQEYFYELKELYGMIKNLPLSANNICYDDYKSNSLLAQYCFNGTNYPSKPDLSLLNLNSRHQNGRNIADRSGGSSNIIDISSKPDIKDLTIIPVVGDKYKYELGGYNAKVDKSSTITLKEITDKDLKTRSAIFPELKTYQLLLKNSQFQTGFYVFFSNTGRVNSVFSQYLLKSNSGWETEIENKLRAFSNM
ncbi:type II secretion system protein [Campylobacter sp. MG1]|uniref:type II secretion system protein n=1 Tax=Campylobacter sp. MG1 TaxID=2976332 RepID=UPI00226C8D30|nr:type II secretion system protein [Campylobacter sp. MG1]